MINKKEKLKKQIIYRSIHRGSKEMDLLLGNFVRTYIDEFYADDLLDLQNILTHDDEYIQKWYFEKKTTQLLPINNVTKLLKKFKL